MKILVVVTLKKDVLDPQGITIKKALEGMSFNNVNEIRQGKYFEIDIDEKNQKKSWRKSWRDVQKTFNKPCYRRL